MKQFTRRIVIVAVLLLVAGLASQILYIINEHEQALVLQFGSPKRTVREPGLHAKLPFIQNVIRFDKRVLTADGAPDEYVTNDKKRLVVDHIARWRITDPLRFYQALTTELGAVRRLADVIDSMLRQEVSSHEFTELINVQREAIMNKVTQNAREATANWGIELLDVRIKRADLPTDVEQSVFDRMEAERSAVASGYRAEGEERALEIRSEADKERDIIIATAYQEAQIIRGEGEAEAIRIYAEAYSRDDEFFAFLQTLDVYENIIGDNTTLVLSADSPLFQYLESPTGATP